MDSSGVQKLGQLAPDPARIHEQTEKIEEGLQSNLFGNLDAVKQKPKFEDFVFFAAAQRAADREEDGVM